ncbi:hypothetical protein F2P79_009085 [Pimephales promelas]|nr:hypothetical protein F2P79_009085 [Pimephales promelas]
MNSSVGCGSDARKRDCMLIKRATKDDRHFPPLLLPYCLSFLIRRRTQHGEMKFAALPWADSRLTNHTLVLSAIPGERRGNNHIDLQCFYGQQAKPQVHPGLPWLAAVFSGQLYVWIWDVSAGERHLYGQCCRKNTGQGLRSFQAKLERYPHSCLVQDLCPREKTRGNH